ncbi:MAG TPA: DUF5777 family beta-barrel protein [Cyclobacteriaceae bacterium]|nr:DUF5777 family beta-barrel protein [Cyclobacteriaceae bacterium]
MKNLKTIYSKTLRVISMFGLLLITTSAFAQEDSVAVQDSGMKPVRSVFESTWIIDNQTTLVPVKGTFEFMMNHRFGTIYNGIKDIYGIYGAGANIRLGFTYTLLDNFGIGAFKGNLSVGFGSTKTGMVQDFNLKYNFLQQTRNGRIPVSVTYYTNMAIGAQGKKEDLPNGNTSDRFSYFHQIIISRKFSDKLSVQVAPSISHFNTVEKTMKNDHIAVAVSGRFKVTDNMALLVNYDQPITKHQDNNPQFNVSAGIEMATSSHQFQIFVTNYPYIVQQYNNVRNQPNSSHEWYQDLFVGFNITRLWNF